MKKGLIVAAIFFCCGYVFAQDYHFSQFYNSPLTLNPALTGKYQGVFRFALNYRNQWFSLSNVKTPYATYSGSFDAPILFAKDAMGVGVVVVNDQAGEGTYKSTHIMGSVAYHKALGRAGKHALSLGLQAGYHQKRLDMARLWFYDEFNPDSRNFDPDLFPSPDRQRIDDDKIGFFDMTVGLLAASQITQKVNIALGFSTFHLTQPNQSFISSGEEDLDLRYVAHAGVEYVFHPRIALLPSVIYMRQRQADELNLGTAFVFKMTETREKTLFYLGGYFRMLPSSASESNFADAAIAYTAFEYQQFKIAFSYDATTSALKNAPKSVGAFEVSVIYTHPFRLPNAGMLLFCPRF